MTSPPTAGASGRAAEGAALRATIRDRGTVRMALLPLIVAGWAGVAVATAAVITVALSTLVPLLVLAAGFEAVAALHASVERIGRYLQVFHEDDGWETVAVAFGRAYPDASPDPLFARLFVFAVSVNFIPAALGGTPMEIGVVAAFHLLLIYRMRMAQRAARRQRDEDLQRFQALRAAGAHRADEPPRPSE